MNEEQFVLVRQTGWNRMNALSAKADISVKNLSGKEFREYIQIYKKCSEDLAIARTQGANDQLIEFLNDLVSKAYSTIYGVPRQSVLMGILEGLKYVAQAARRQKVFIFTAFFTLVLLSISIGFLMDIDPETRAVFLPPSQQANVQGWLNGIPERSASESALMTGVYAANNPFAAIMIGSIGVASFGLGTLYELYQNASGMGALGHEMAHAGKLGYLLGSILPHGVNEIGGFMLASGAGLAMGFALIHPGRLRRGEALARVGKDAIALVGASVVMTWIAAPIEGWFSFNPIVPMPIKLLFALVEAIAWYFFFTGFGREPTDPKATNTPAILHATAGKSPAQD